jgi:hypothetical protein
MSPYVKKQEPKPKKEPPTVFTADPLNVNARLYRHISMLLDELDRPDCGLTAPQRVQSIIAIGRVMIMQMNLRKESSDDQFTGSAVREATKAFGSNAANRRKSAGRAIRSAADAALADALDDDEDDDA